YNLGGIYGYAIVPRIARDKDAPDLAKLVPFTPAGHFFRIPDSVTVEGPSRYFYPSRPVTSDLDLEDRSVRLCHFDAKTRALGCRLCVDDPTKCTTTDDSDAR